MQPERATRALADAIVDPALSGNPRPWETAVEIRLDPDSEVLRSAPSFHHRTTQYQVGRSMSSATPLSKLFGIPDTVSERDLLRLHTRFNPATTEPAPVADNERVLMHSCVVITVGAKRGALVDTQRHQLALVPRAVGQFLADRRDTAFGDLTDDASGFAASRLREWLAQLVTADFAFATSEPASRFPAIDLTRESPGAIAECVVDIDASSDHDLRALANELDELRCQHLELRYWMPVDVERAAADLQAFETSRLRTIQVIAPAVGFDDGNGTREASIEALCINHARLALLTLHGATEDRVIGGPYFRAQWTKADPGAPDACGNVHPLYFSFGIEAVAKAQAGDSCLLGKVGIDTTGGIRNCPTHPSQHGVLGQIALADVVQRDEFTRPALQTKNDVTDCDVCEFRDICSACQVRAPGPTAKPETCRYDPRAGSWTEVAT